MINPDIIFGRLGNRLFQGAYIYAQMKRGEIPDIYVQNYKLFDEYKAEIQNLFGEGIGYLPYTAIHLRVGSNPINPNEPKYSENPFYVNLSKTDYYTNAMKLFPDRKFLVFSDDPEYARFFFQGEQFEFDETKDDIECLNRMASCEGHIIANSSYSFWGAYLSPHKGLVVAPSQWFFDGVERVVAPKEWIRI